MTLQMIETASVTMEPIPIHQRQSALMQIGGRSAASYSFGIDLVLKAFVRSISPKPYMEPC